MDETTMWLMEGEPWTRYRTQVDLLGKAEDDADVRTSRAAMVDHPQVRALLDELAAWPGPALKRHNDASHLLHKLVFAANLGLRVGDPGVDAVIERVLAHQAPEGPFQITLNIPRRFGGTGEDGFGWMLCDAPLAAYALVKLGLGDDPRVQGAVDYLTGLVRENGWPCAATPDVGKFRGPGSAKDPCPYANLIMLKLLALRSETRDSDAARIGVETLLALWEQREERRPYLFAMGTHFDRLKAPLIWYDILHVTDVLSRFPAARDDARLQAMARRVAARADDRGRFKPESIWMAWKGWDFGQKREPSRWLTYLAQRMLQRIPIKNEE